MTTPRAVEVDPDPAPVGRTIVVGSYRAYIVAILLSSIAGWSFGVYANHARRQSLIVFAVVSALSIPRRIQLESLMALMTRMSPGHQHRLTKRRRMLSRTLPGCHYRLTARTRVLAQALWPFALALAGIWLAQGELPDVLAAIEGAFFGVVITWARELRIIASAERRYGGRVFIELTGRSTWFGSGREKLRLWLLPTHPDDPATAEATGTRVRS